VEKKEDSQLRIDIIICLIVIVIGFLSIILICSNNASKTISELQDLDNGNYYATGFISNVNNVNNVTSFTLSDETSSIYGVILSDYNLVNGNVIAGYCQITNYKNKKECVFKKELIKIIS